MMITSELLTILGAFLGALVSVAIGVRWLHGHIDYRIKEHKENCTSAVELRTKVDNLEGWLKSIDTKVEKILTRVQ